MSSYRRDTQKSVGFYADVAFISILEGFLRKARINKSQFIRDAIAEKLVREGIGVPDDITIPQPPYAQISGIGNMNSGHIGSINVGRVPKVVSANARKLKTAK